MDGVDLVPLLQKLEENIDDLEETLEPLLQSKLSDVAKASPLLDKAKLHVLITYSIESLLFCTSSQSCSTPRTDSAPAYLRLHGVNAREHPVFTELTRLQQYFAKIDTAEKGPTQRENMSLNVPAVDRILKHDLVSHPTPRSANPHLTYYRPGMRNTTWRERSSRLSRELLLS
jgi:exosome complex protein LRP1